SRVGNSDIVEVRVIKGTRQGNNCIRQASEISQGFEFLTLIIYDDDLKVAICRPLLYRLQAALEQLNPIPDGNNDRNQGLTSDLVTYAVAKRSNQPIDHLSG